MTPLAVTLFPGQLRSYAQRSGLDKIIFHIEYLLAQLIAPYYHVQFSLLIK